MSHTIPSTLIPAYGRDYKSKAAALADFEAGKDFMIADFSHPDDGRYANKADLPDGAVLNIRYKRLTMLCVVKVKA